MLKSTRFCIVASMGVLLLVGCGHFRKPHITAVSLDPCHFGQETGIPFYLPKPLLIVAKNFRNIEEAKVGLTDTVPIPDQYDDQAKYADLNARTNFQGLGNTNSGTPSPATPANAAGGTAQKSAPHVFSQNGAPITPGKAPEDGLAPDTFFTYQIVFVPDLTQKYGLKIRGGPGEIRAAMNLVNGWQFTGLGPYYMKDSSTAQNVLSGGIATRLGGQAVADVLKEVNDFGSPGGGTQGGGIAADDGRVQRLAQTIGSLPKECVPMTLTDFAEIYVYEASLGPDGMMQWLPIANHTFHRDYLGPKQITCETMPAQTAAGGDLQSGVIDPIYRKAMSKALGIEEDGGGLQSGTLQSGSLQNGSVPSGGVNQIHVECGEPCEKACDPPLRRGLNLFRLGGHEKKRGKIQTKVVRGDAASFLTVPSGFSAQATPPVEDPALNQAVGGGAGGAGAGGEGLQSSGGVLQSGDLGGEDDIEQIEPSPNFEKDEPKERSLEPSNQSRVQFISPPELN